MKYKIDDRVYYVYSSTNYQKTITCPMCFGKRFVTIILGDESEIKSPCGACDKGLEYATGTATTWEPESVAKEGRITGVSTRNGVKYDVDGSSFYENELFDDADEAEKMRLIKLDEVTKRAEQWKKENFINCSKKQIWSARYHQSSIESAERSIDWHKMRLGLITGRHQRTAPRGESK